MFLCIIVPLWSRTKSSTACIKSLKSGLPINLDAPILKSFLSFSMLTIDEKTNIGTSLNTSFSKHLGL